MRFPNKLRALYEDPAKRSLIQACAITLLALFVIGVLILLFQRSNKNPGDTGRYYDRNSGEVVSDPTGKGPDTYGETDSQMIYLGFSKLTELGLTKYQLASLQACLQQYSATRQNNVKEVSISVNTIKQAALDKESTTGDLSLTFDLTINRTELYQAQLFTRSLTTAKLILKQGDKQILDSGFVDATEIKELGD